MLPDQMKEVLLAAAMMKHKLFGQKTLPLPLGDSSSAIPMDSTDGANNFTCTSGVGGLALGGAGVDSSGTLHAPSALPIITNPHVLPFQGACFSFFQAYSSAFIHLSLSM